MLRGEVWWAYLPEPLGSGPGFRRPVLVVQGDSFNASRIRTVVVLIVTSNLRLARAPGNVFLPSQESGLPEDSVINVSQIAAVDKELLTDYVATLSEVTMDLVNHGLANILDL